MKTLASVAVSAILSSLVITLIVIILYYLFSLLSTFILVFVFVLLAALIVTAGSIKNKKAYAAVLVFSLLYSVLIAGTLYLLNISLVKFNLLTIVLFALITLGWVFVITFIRNALR